LGPLMAPFVATFLDPSEAEGLAMVQRNLPRDLLVTLGLLALLAGYMGVQSARVRWALLALLGAGHLQQSQKLHEDLNATVPTSVLSYRPKYLELMAPKAH